MILNSIDVGGSHPFPAPDAGQTVGTTQVEGGRSVVWARGMKGNDHRATFWSKAWQAIGGQAANTINANRYQLKQLEELANNPDLQPVYIRWQATADPAAALNVDDQHDGWYAITSLVPDYRRIVSGLIPVKMTARLVASGVPRTQAVWYSGGTLASNYSGTSQIAIGYPLNSTNQAATLVSRTGGEGAVPVSIAPSASFNPLNFTPSATVGDWFKGGCHVYDTVTAGGNAVPTTGAFTHANWVEVFAPDHRFEGDCIITNGLHLYRFQVGATVPATCYLWSTAQATPGWLQFGQVEYIDDAGNGGAVQNWSLERLGSEGVALATYTASVGRNWGLIRFRLNRGQYFSRLDFTPLSQSNTDGLALLLVYPANPKIAYNSTKAADQVLDPNFGAATDFGYGAAFVNSASYPFIAGFLAQNQPANLPQISNSTYIAAGDSSGPAQNATRTYGIFAMPYGSNGNSTEKLQAEAESGTLGTGWSSVTDAGASTGNTAKAASGTLSGNTDRFGASFSPASGTYDVWFRVKVTSTAGSSGEMSLGIWDPTAGAFVAGGSTTYAANQAALTYVWLRAATGLALPAAHATQFLAQTAATLGTDWFVDEAVLVPKTLSAANTGPQELFQQFLHDRTARITRI